MVKSRKIGGGARSRLRAKVAKLALKKETESKLPDDHDDNDAMDDDSVVRPSKPERQALKKRTLLEKLQKSTLSVKATIKKKQRNRKTSFFDWGGMGDALGKVKIEKKLVDSGRAVSRDKSRLKAVKEFTGQMESVWSSDVYQSDPLGSTMKYLEATLPTPSTMEEINEKHRKELRKKQQKKEKLRKAKG